MLIILLYNVINKVVTFVLQTDFITLKFIRTSIVIAHQFKNLKKKTFYLVKITLKTSFQAVLYLCDQRKM